MRRCYREFRTCSRGQPASLRRAGTARWLSRRAGGPCSSCLRTCLSGWRWFRRHGRELRGRERWGGGERERERKRERETDVLRMSSHHASNSASSTSSSVSLPRTASAGSRAVSWLQSRSTLSSSRRTVLAIFMPTRPSCCTCGSQQVPLISSQNSKDPNTKNDQWPR